MATFVAAGTPGTTSASLPTGTASGDWVIVFAYRNAATAPTLPASWTTITTIGTVNSVLVARRQYDGVWTMPTFTNATRCDSVTVRPAAGKALQPGITETVNKSQTNVVWNTVTMQVTDGSSIIFRGVAHTRPDGTSGSAFPLPTDHTLISQTGTQPGYGTWRKTTNVTNMNTVTSAISRNTTYTTTQVEIRDFSQVEATTAATFTFTTSAAADAHTPIQVDASIVITFTFTTTADARSLQTIEASIATTFPLTSSMIASRNPAVLAEYQEIPYSTLESADASFPSISWEAGDVLVIIWLASDDQITVVAPTVAGLTFTAISGAALSPSLGTCVRAWSAKATSAGSGAILVNVSSGFNFERWGASLWRWQAAHAVGDIAVSAAQTNLAALGLTTADGAGVVGVKSAYESTVTGYTGTPLNGLTERQDMTPGGSLYAVWVGDWTSQPGGNRNYGVTSTSGTNDTVLLIEILPLPVQAAIATTFAFTATATATVTPGNVELSGDALWAWAIVPDDDQYDPDTAEITVGTQWSVDSATNVTGMRYYRPPFYTSATTLQVRIWNADTTALIYSGTSAITGGQWVDIPITPLAVSSGVNYRVAVHFPGGRYPLIYSQVDHTSSPFPREVGLLNADRTYYEYTTDADVLPTQFTDVFATSPTPITATAAGVTVEATATGVFGFTASTTATVLTPVQATATGIFGFTGSVTATASWAPSSLGTALQHWFKANDPATITASAGAVSQWNDKSANARHHTQATGANQPTTGTRTINGCNAIDFDGTTDNMVGPTFSLANPFTIAVVAQTDTVAAGFGKLFGRGTTTNVTIGRSGDDALISNGINKSVIDQWETTTAHIIVGIFNGPSWIVFDGVTTAVTTTGTGGFSGTTILGAATGSTAFWDGPIGEIVTTNTVVSLTELQNIVGYLATEWGLTASVPTLPTLVSADITTAYSFATSASATVVAPNVVEATAAGPFTFSATANASITGGLVPATISQTYTFIGTVAAVTQLAATIAQSYTFSTTAAATNFTVRQATVAQTYVFNTNADAIKQPEAIALGTYSFTTTSTAVRTTAATVSGPYTFIATATADRTTAAVVAQTYTFTATATAATTGVLVPATIAQTYNFTATSTATRQLDAIAASSFAFSTTSTATPSHVATAASTFTFTTTSTALPTHEATAVGAYTFVTNATSTRQPEAVVLGAYMFTTTATAVRTTTATAVGPFTFSTTAAATPVHEAVFTASYTFTASAIASSFASGTAIINQTYVFSTTATAVRTTTATIATAHTFSTTASATPEHVATATGPFTFSTTAAALPTVNATVAGPFTFSPTAVALPQHVVTVATNYIFTATATAATSAPGQATIAQTYLFATTASALPTVSASVAGPFVFDANAIATVGPLRPATITTAFLFVATADAARQIAATATGLFGTLTATATALAMRPASVVTTFSFSATAAAQTTHVVSITTVYDFSALASSVRELTAVVDSSFLFSTTADAAAGKEAIIATEWLFEAAAMSGAFAVISASAVGQFFFTALATARISPYITILNDADEIFIGTTTVEAVYVGDELVWSL
jgi:Domain of unknown function (DUF4082)